MEGKKVCGSCRYFIGAGDFNLCCEKHSWLCYRDSEACELYEYSEEKVRQLEEPCEYDNYPIPPYDSTISEEDRAKMKEETRARLETTISRIVKRKVRIVTAS